MTRRPKNASSTSSGTTTAGERSRSSSSAETTYPTAPPPSRSGLVSPLTGCGLPLAMCTMPSRPKLNAAQPITWRPTGPLETGSRMTRQAASSTRNGTNQPTFPTVPATTVRTNSITPPGTSNQTPAATTRARPQSRSPIPSRRCSGSISLAPPTTPRATAPTPCAIPSQIAASARASALNACDTGPGPLRTARGAGRRLAVLRFEVGRFLAVLRDRELDPALVVLPLPRLLDVLRLRDRVGEDVRVAMLMTLLIGHICPRDHVSVSAPQTPLASPPEAVGSRGSQASEVALAGAQASTTTGMIIGRRLWVLLTQRPIVRRTDCCSW